MPDDNYHVRKMMRQDYFKISHYRITSVCSFLVCLRGPGNRSTVRPFTVGRTFRWAAMDAFRWWKSVLSRRISCATGKI